MATATCSGIYRRSGHRKSGRCSRQLFGKLLWGANDVEYPLIQRTGRAVIDLAHAQFGSSVPVIHQNRRKLMGVGFPGLSISDGVKPSIDNTD